MKQEKQKTQKPRAVLYWTLSDILLVNAALMFSQLLWRTAQEDSFSFWNGLRLSPVITLIFWLCFCLAGMYTTIWRYANMKDMLTIIGACAVATVLSLGASLLLNSMGSLRGNYSLNWPVFLLFGLFSMVLTTGIRVGYHILVIRERAILLRGEETEVRKAMIIGAGWSGADVVHDIQSGSYGNCVPAVVVDDDPTRTGSQISGVPVERGTGNILRLASEYRVDDIFIAIATPNGDISHIVEKCIATGCRVRRIYPPQEVRSRTMNQAPEQKPTEVTPQTHEAFMREALLQAREAYEEGEIPVGAVMVHEGRIIAKAHNTREQGGDPTAHAEILVIREAAQVLGRRRLDGCCLYVTLEPCPMCAGAMIMSGLSRCYFAARDERQGCAESVYALTQDPAFFHHVACIGGLLEEESAELLKRFFSERREQKEAAREV